MVTEIGPLAFTMSDMADPIPLRELEARLREFRELDEARQWSQAKDLIEISKASLQAVRDEAINALTRRHTAAEVAQMLKISVKTVEKSVTRHRKRTGSTS